MVWYAVIFNVPPDYEGCLGIESWSHSPFCKDCEECCVKVFESVSKCTSYCSLIHYCLSKASGDRWFTLPSALSERTAVTWPSLSWASYSVVCTESGVSVCACVFILQRFPTDYAF